MSGIFHGVNRDLAVTGALLHDLGKLDAYRRIGEDIEMTDAGRLHGEIALGYSRIRDEIGQIDGFPPELSQALLHIILSHHGSLQHGSPVVPCTREATLVHMADNLGSKLGSFDRVERALDEGAQRAATTTASVPLPTSASMAPRPRVPGSRLSARVTDRSAADRNRSRGLQVPGG